MTTELTQITNLVKSKNEKVENICHKEAHKIRLDKKDDSNPIVFNTKGILTNIIIIVMLTLNFNLILNLQQLMPVQKQI